MHIWDSPPSSHIFIPPGLCVVCVVSDRDLRDSSCLSLQKVQIQMTTRAATTIFHMCFFIFLSPLSDLFPFPDCDCNKNSTVKQSICGKTGFPAAKSSFRSVIGFS